MFTAIIENEGNTLVMEFPCKRYLMADHLGSIGLRMPAHEIKCMDEEEEPIKVKIVGNNEFEKRLALLISPTDTLSLVNTMCEFYQNLPYQNRLDAMEAVMSGKVSAIAEFDMGAEYNQRPSIFTNLLFQFTQYSCDCNNFVL